MRTLAPLRRPTPWQNAVTSTDLKVERECDLLDHREKAAYLDTMIEALRRRRRAIDEAFGPAA